MRAQRHTGLTLIAAVAATAALVVGPFGPAGAATRTVWPTAGSGVTYATPTAAARGFALDLLGIEAPLVSPLRASGSGGTVALRRSAAGAATTVAVSRAAAGWVVTGSAFADVRVTSPTPGELVGATVSLAGRSTAFEGVVNYVVRTDAGRVLARGTVLGGGSGALAPFRATIHLAHATGAGEVIVSTRSARDGSTLGASVVRVGF